MTKILAGILVPVSFMIAGACMTQYNKKTTDPLLTNEKTNPRAGQLQALKSGKPTTYNTSDHSQYFGKAINTYNQSVLLKV